MFVTVLDNSPYTKEEVTGGVFAEAKVVTTTSHDRSGYGEVLIVLAIDLPYVAVRYEDEYESDRFVTKIDTRRTRLMELSDEYVLAMYPHLTKVIKEKNKKNEQ